MKECTICGLMLPEDQFTLATDKRRTPPYVYRQSWCIPCKRTKNLEYYRRNRGDDNFMQKRREQALSYRERNLEKVLARQRSPQTKERMRQCSKKWYQAHREHVLKLTRDRLKKHIDNLTDAYIANQLKAQFGISTKQALADKELIAWKRAEILTYRLNQKTDEKQKQLGGAKQPPIRSSRAAIRKRKRIKEGSSEGASNSASRKAGM